METANASKFHCPYCKGKRLQVATSTEFGTFTNVSRNKVTTTVLSSNTRYWVCQDCGNTFPFPQDVKEQADALVSSAKLNKGIAIAEAIAAGVLFLMSCLIPFFMIFMVICLLAAVMCGSSSSSDQEKAQKLYAEYENLLSKCTD